MPSADLPAMAKVETPPFGEVLARVLGRRP